ncbi:hypothetical protein MBLNU230_g4944t1 [Neophaeotheca triangularis]
MKHNPDKPARQRYLAKRKAALKERSAAKKRAKRERRAVAEGGESSVFDEEMPDTAISDDGAPTDAPHLTPGAETKRSVTPALTASLEEPSTAPPLITPNITENDLLAFQLKHFGDATKPDNFFIGYDVAWLGKEQQCQTTYEDDEHDDDLGYYENGVKRTITDAEIAFMRRSELEKMLLKQGERQGHGVEAAEASALNGGSLRGANYSQSSREVSEGTASEPQKAEQCKSDMNKDIARFLRNHAHEKEKSLSESEAKAESGFEEMQLHGGLGTKSKLLQHERSSGKRNLSLASIGELRRRTEQIPYAQRNKRKWEKYIDEEEDPEQGWVTHNRRIREMDEIKVESVELDY